MITVRRYKNKDKEQFLELAQDLFDTTYFSSVAELDREHIANLLDTDLESDIGAAFVAETEEGDLIGIVAGVKFPLWMSPEHTAGQEIMYYVKPEFRRSKAGKKLFNAFEKWAREVGADYVTVASPSNENEKRLGTMYESKGYSPVERHYTKVF